MQKNTLVYIMGAGRSGTTALATFLGNNKKIQNIGEMHQFFKYLEENKKCSCGEYLQKCEFWKNKINHLKKDSFTKNRELSKKMESHLSIIKHFVNIFSNSENIKYQELHNSLLDSIFLDTQKYILVDSSKYVGRALALNRLKNIDLKIIYVVRDVRGVISSFSKKVQTPKSPISSIIYYLLVNLVAEFVSRFFLNRKTIKIRYEDLMQEPYQILEKIELFLKADFNDIKQKIKKENSFKIGHIVGGNRIKEKKHIFFKYQDRWRFNYSFLQRLVFYICAFPIMFLNKYKI